VVATIPNFDELHALRRRRLEELSEAIRHLEATIHKDYEYEHIHNRLIAIRTRRVGWLIEQVTWADLAIEWRRQRAAAAKAHSAIIL
jgi:hypothetical protein